MDSKGSKKSQPWPSDLPEVVPSSGPESFAYFRDRPEPGLIPPKYLAYDQTQKEVNHGNAASPVSPENLPSDNPPPPTPDEGDQDHEKARAAKPTPTVCGCPRRVFWLIVCIGCLATLAAVGGGVGGALAARSQRGDPSTQPAASTSSPTPATAAVVSSTSTTAAAAAAATSADTSAGTADAQNLSNTTQTFSFQAYEDLNYQGRKTPIYRKIGGFSFDFNVTSYVWKQDDDKVCCTTFCSGHKWGGWRCSTFYRPNATGPFDNIIIDCGNESEDNSRLKC